MNELVKLKMKWKKTMKQTKKKKIQTIIIMVIMVHFPVEFHRIDHFFSNSPIYISFDCSKHSQ